MNDVCVIIITKCLYLKKFLADQQLSRLQEDMHTCLGTHAHKGQHQL